MTILTRRLFGSLGLTLGALALTFGFSGSEAAGPAASVGKAAPDFTLPATDGSDHALADYRGKTVVLEWTNHLCPYVGKHYGTGNMQALQKEATEDGVVWFSIISSAPGTQGYVDPEEADRLTEERGASPTAVLFDTAGTVGRSYGAVTTPHMYVIDPEGTLIYAGGIDDRPTARHADVEGATNYVRAALADHAAGRAVAVSTARPYGCSIKYAPAST